MLPNTIARAPGSLPLLGHARQLTRDPLGFLESQRALGPLVRVNLGPTPAYVLNDPELVQRVLVRDAGSFDKGRLFEKLRDWLGEGLFNSEGATHRARRRMMQPAFHHREITRYCRVMAEEAERVSAGWHDGQIVSLDEEMHELTLGIVARALFSAEVVRSSSREIGESLSVLLPLLARRSLSPLGALEKLPTPAKLRFDREVVRIRAGIGEIIRVYRHDGSDDHADLLTMLLRADDPGAPDGLRDTHIQDEVISVMSAGTDTSAATMSWLFHELARHPEVERKLHEELDAVLTAGPVSYEQTGKLEYTRAVVSETLRMDCPIWITMRRATSTVELGGHRLPAGTQFIISPRTLHRDPTVFPDPLRFDPLRWLAPRQPEPRQRLAYLPFGAGRRKCIGDSFAWYEMVIAVATIARRWRLSLGARTGGRGRTSAVAKPEARPVTVHDRTKSATTAKS
ncbi:cytochrome P450 [Amycolatopsis samaneae]|uniref:Cytochrome P450 n=1 Tax=Amycolatopsis samaneae TaxID=664691 RepID=A0ABW5GWA2_9PSEU